MRFSAGLLPFRSSGQTQEVFLVHIAGPYWAHKDEGAWSIAKGEYDPQVEDPWEVAQREFLEEVGMEPPQGDPLDLGEFRMPSGKRVRVFAVATATPLAFVSSNLFSLEWPPRSGQIQQFPETDDARWFGIDAAMVRIVAGQREIITALAHNRDLT